MSTPRPPTAGNDRPLPQDFAVEQHVLSILMLPPVYAVDHAKARDLIRTPEIFYHPAHRAIFAAIMATFPGFGVDPLAPVLVIAELAKGNGAQLALAGGEEYIFQLATVAVHSAWLDRDIQRLTALHLVRGLAHAGAAMVEAGFTEGDAAEDALDRAQASLKALDAYREPRAPAGMAEAVRSAFDKVEAARAGQQVTVPWGLPWLDATCPIHPGDDDLCIVAARPGVGKTTLVASCLLAQAMAGVPVGLIGFEMSREAMVYRLASHLSGIPYGVIKSGMRGRNRDMELWLKAVETLTALPIFFECNGALSARQCASIVRRWKQDHGIQCFWLDHVNDIIGDAQYRERRDAVSAALGVLKQVAADTATPGLIMAQLNRAGAGKTPDLIHLAETGKLEQIASIVILMDRPDIDPPPGNKRPYFDTDRDGHRTPMDTAGKVVLRCAKDRNGKLGMVGLPFNERLMQIGDSTTIWPRDIDPAHIPPPPRDITAPQPPDETKEF